MQITTNTTAVTQIEPATENAFFTAIKKAVKKAIRPQWKKWNDACQVNRFVEAVWMQQFKQDLSPANRQQIDALQSEIQQTKLLANHCFTQKPTKLRTKQLCGQFMTEKERQEAFNYAVESHFKVLSRGVLPTEDNQWLSRIREEAFAIVFKNTPPVKDVLENAWESANTNVDQLRWQTYERKLERELAVPPQCLVQDPDFASLRHNWKQLNLRNTQVVETESEEILCDSATNILKEMNLIVETVQAALNATPEVAEITEVTPVTEELQVINTSLSKKMTIKELKAYAKAHKIHVPGRKTKHRDIYDHIRSQMSQA